MSSCSSDGGFNKLICEEDLHDSDSYPHPKQGSQQAFKRNMIPGRLCKAAAVSLAVLAAVLLIVDIGLGVHYKKLIDTHLTFDDVNRMISEVYQLQDTYKTAVETLNSAKKQLDSELSRQTPTKWELDHQTKRTTEYAARIDQITKQIAEMKTHLPVITDNCRHCPPGWIFMQSVCYYFPDSENTIVKNWKQSREFCQTHGGDLAVIDSKDKEKSIVNFLRNNSNPHSIHTHWIGLSDKEEEGTWKWVDGTHLVEAYWTEGEPSTVSSNEDCVAVYPSNNFFEAWMDNTCGTTKKWICERAATTLS